VGAGVALCRLEATPRSLPNKKWPSAQKRKLGSASAEEKAGQRFSGLKPAAAAKTDEIGGSFGEKGFINIIFNFFLN
jgi:hypothetical protein